MHGTIYSLDATGDEQFGFLIMDILRLLRADYGSRTRGMALTPQLHRLLLLVHRHPGCRQVELADWLEITPVTVGRMLDRLEKQELVRRDSHPDDRRAVRVQLTPEALPLVGKLADIAVLSREAALQGIGTSERRALVASLRRVHRNLTQEALERGGRRRAHGC
jgi:DNA-binding MarR family transcriptional regulator